MHFTCQPSPPTRGIRRLGWGGMGYAALGMGRPDVAAEPLDRGIRLAERVGNAFLEGLWKAVQGMLVFIQGDLDGALALLDEAQSIQVPRAEVLAMLAA